MQYKSVENSEEKICNKSNKANISSQICKIDGTPKDLWWSMFFQGIAFIVCEFHST